MTICCGNQPVLNLVKPVNGYGFVLGDLRYPVILHQGRPARILCDDKFLRTDLIYIVDHVCCQSVLRCEIGKTRTIITAKTTTGAKPDKPTVVLVNIKYIIIYETILYIIFPDIDWLGIGEVPA